MSFFRRANFGSRSLFGSRRSSSGKRLGMASGRDLRCRRLQLEPLEDRTLLSVGVSGMVWNDANLNGLQDADESSMARVMTTYIKSTDDIFGNADDAPYAISFSPPIGSYTVQFTEGFNYFAIVTPPEGYAFTRQDVGNDDSIDSDVDKTGFLAMFTSEMSIKNLDIGLVEVTADTNAPVVTLSVPGSTQDVTPQVTVTSLDQGVGVAYGETVHVDVDLNNDGDFNDDGEIDYTSAAIFDNTASFAISPKLSAGTYNLRARVSDWLGNEGASEITPMTIDLTGLTVDFSTSSLTNDSTPSVTVTAAYDGSSLVGSKSVYLDIDINNDGDFGDSGEVGYSSSVLSNGEATFEISPALADGTYNLRVRVSNGPGDEGVSGVEAITVDVTGPEITLAAPRLTNDSSPAITVTATDGVSGVAERGTVSLDIDLNNDGDFDDAGEASYTSSILFGGTITFDISPELAQGNYNLRARVYDILGNENTSLVAPITVDLTGPDVTPPEGYVFYLAHTYFTELTSSSTYLNIRNAEPECRYNLIVTSDGGEGAVHLSGTIMGRNASIDNIDVSGLPDGWLTFSLTLTDAAGNTGDAAVAKAILNQRPPEGYAITIDDDMIEASEASNLSFTITDAELNATYDYIIQSNCGGAVSGSGTVKSSTVYVTGIDVSGLSDGILTFRVKLTDQYGKAGEAVTGTATLDATDVHFSVRGLVWNDTDFDGVRDLSEKGAIGAVAEIYSSSDDAIGSDEGMGNEDDMLFARAITDTDGHYLFENIPDGSKYYVVIHAPVGCRFTEMNVGGNGTLDSDVDAVGGTALFMIAAGQTSMTIDAGLVGASPDFGWALNSGAAIQEAAAQAVVLDDAGNAYIAGYFGGTVDFDPGPGEFNLTSAGDADVFVAKYSAEGALVWAKNVGGTGADKALDIVRTEDGSLFVTGYFYDTADFDPGATSSS